VLSAARNREDGPMPRDGTFILSDLRSPTLSMFASRATVTGLTMSRASWNGTVIPS
jgi:hypothetical protein